MGAGQATSVTGRPWSESGSLSYAWVAYATSLLSSQAMVTKMLGYGDNQEPEDLPQPLQDLIFARQGDEATTGSLTGVTQSMASLKVDLQNKSLLLHHCDLEDDERERARLGSVGLPHSGD